LWVGRGLRCAHQHCPPSASSCVHATQRLPCVATHRSTQHIERIGRLTSQRTVSSRPVALACPHTAHPLPHFCLCARMQLPDSPTPPPFPSATHRTLRTTGRASLRWTSTPCRTAHSGSSRLMWMACSQPPLAHPPRSQPTGQHPTSRGRHQQQQLPPAAACPRRHQQQQQHSSQGCLRSHSSRSRRRLAPCRRPRSSRRSSSRRSRSSRRRPSSSSPGPPSTLVVCQPRRWLGRLRVVRVLRAHTSSHMTWGR
jgi:hypothetical protein